MSTWTQAWKGNGPKINTEAMLELGRTRLYRVMEISSRSVRGRRSSQVMDCTWVCMWSLNLIYVC
ncbi:hypothetical protein HanXRQr2_Chr02g0076471 [Helianthus annuus]|nr:hypothetical protein HanXRQr2_Chr02g0076471 [Helianthus annuus]KAJ0952598.1 hypothetical protein HanPSC8_Chr02g0074181 [Helianthus annuus]